LLSLLKRRRTLGYLSLARARARLEQLTPRHGVVWHGVRRAEPDWSDNSHSIALEVSLTGEATRVYLILNAFSEELEFELPANRDGLHWRRWLDTSRRAPEDIVDWWAACAHGDPAYRAKPHSVVVLWEGGGSCGPAANRELGGEDDVARRGRPSHDSETRTGREVST
jgi:glycogen operon protein